jgi:hypothetical protein
MVRGCDVTLPVEPLKLRAAVEVPMPAVAPYALAQTGLAIRIAARGRRAIFFTTNCSEDWE